MFRNLKPWLERWALYLHSLRYLYFIQVFPHWKRQKDHTQCTVLLTKQPCCLWLFYVSLWSFSVSFDSILHLWRYFTSSCAGFKGFCFWECLFLVVLFHFVVIFAALCGHFASLCGSLVSYFDHYVPLSGIFPEALWPLGPLDLCPVGPLSKAYMNQHNRS